MSQKNSYWPKAISILLVWLQNFSTKFATYGALLGYSPAEITDEQAAIAVVVNAINNAEAAAAAAKAANADRNTKISNLKTPLNKKVQEIKANSGYSQQIGEGLQVIGSEDTFNPITFKTTLTYVLFVNYVQLKFVKAGFLGVNI